MYKLRLLRNTKRNLKFFIIYFHNIEINKNVKYWKKNKPCIHKTCDRGDNDEGDDDEGDGSSIDVGLDNVSAVDGENKFDPGDAHNGGGHSNDDVWVDDVGELLLMVVMVLTLIMMIANLIVCDDRNDGDGYDNNDGGTGDDCNAHSNIVNDVNCGDGWSKVDCSKDTAVDDDNSKLDGGGDTNDDRKGGEDSEG